MSVVALDKGSQALPKLRRRLSRSRGRLRGQLLFSALTLSLLSTCALYLSLYLFALWRQAPPGTILLWSSFFFVGVFCVLAGRAWLRTPSLLGLARRADRQFGLYESSSTALELAAGPTSAAIDPGLARAVLADAERLAPRISPRQMAPFVVPSAAWLSLALLAVITVLHLGLPNIFAPARSPSTLAFSEDQRLATVTRLRQTAELLEEEADKLQDPYLQALAQAFDELSERVEAQDISATEAGLKLNRLLDHLDRAYDGALRPQEAASEQEPLATETPPESASQRQANGALPASGLSSPELDELLAQLALAEDALQAAADRRAAQSATISLEDLQAFGPYVNPESLEALRELQERREQEALARAGQPIGAAQQSNAGAGDLAGEGSLSLGEAAGPDAFEGLETQAQEMLLPEADDALGERIERVLSPETNFTEVADDGDAQTLDWQASKETELRRDLLLPRDRLVASRYFERPDDATAGR